MRVLNLPVFIKMLSNLQLFTFAAFRAFASVLNGYLIRSFVLSKPPGRKMVCIKLLAENWKIIYIGNQSFTNNHSAPCLTPPSKIYQNNYWNLGNLPIFLGRLPRNMGRLNFVKLFYLFFQTFFYPQNSRVI